MTANWTEIITRTLKLPHNIYNNETYKITTILGTFLEKAPLLRSFLFFTFDDLKPLVYIR